MRTSRRFFTLSSITALGAALLPAASDAESSAGELPAAAPSANERQSEFERYLTGAAAAQCEGARQMCGSSQGVSND